MLADDDGEERCLERVQLALEEPETIEPRVWVLGRVDNIAAIGELRGVGVVNRLEHEDRPLSLGRPS